MRVVSEFDIILGKKLRISRLLFGMSQGQLGAHLGVSFQQVQKYERGTNRITAETISKCPAILGQPLEYFMDAQPVEEFPGGKLILHIMQGVSGLSFSQKKAVLATINAMRGCDE